MGLGKKIRDKGWKDVCHCSTGLSYPTGGVGFEPTTHG